MKTIESAGFCVAIKQLQECLKYISVNPCMMNTCNLTKESLFLKGLPGLNNNTNFISKNAHLTFSVLIGETLLVG